MKHDIAKIIDFLYSEPSIPEDLLAQIQAWMKRNEDNQEVTTALLNLWDEEYGKHTVPINAESVERLLSEVESHTNAPTMPRRSPIRRVFAYAAAIAAVVLIGALSYIVGAGSAGHETMLITAQSSAGTFTLPDGSTVRLNSDSRLTYNTDEFMKSAKRKVKIEGEAYFDVTKDKNHPFVVEMADMEVQVLGTSFEVRDYSFSGIKEVVLLTGKVEVTTPASSSPSLLYPDQRLIYDTDTHSCTIEDANAETYCRWIYPKLKLENEPLGAILITIGRKYSMDLNISPNVDLKQCISITLANDDLDELMSALEYLTGLDYSISGNTLSIY